MITSRATMFPRDKALLAVCDLACLAGALIGAVILRLGASDGLEYLRQRTPDLLLVWILFPLAFYVCGLYDARRLASPARTLVPAAASVAVALMAGGSFWYARSAPPIGRGIVVELSLLVFVSLVSARIVYAKIRGALKIRSLVVGTPELAASVSALIRCHPESRMNVLGLVLCEIPLGGEAPRPLQNATAYPVLGTLDELEDLVSSRQVDRLILPANLLRSPELLRRLRPLRYRGVALVDFVSLHEELAREIPLDQIDDEWLFRAATMTSQMHIRRLKRMTDVVASLLLLIPAAPVLLVAAAAMKLTSRGPALFRQERVGLGARPFTVLKLRTMYEDAEKLTGPVWSMTDDPRITRVGKVLRKFRVDELPQLWNVLRGNMSLVGPRPERPVFVQKLAETIPFYSERLLVRPGITGWAQVMAPYAATVGDSARKLQFDLYYTKNLSFSLDLLILLMTAKTVLFGRERVQGGMTAGKQLATTPVPLNYGFATLGPVVPPRLPGEGAFSSQHDGREMLQV